MERIREDLISVYNSLTEFSDGTLLSPTPTPIRVSFSESLNTVCFEQMGLKVSISALNYYCKDLKGLKEAYLLPEDYDTLMTSLGRLITSGDLLHDRLCISPEKYGFSIYDMLPGINNLKEGPQLKMKLKFVSVNSWFFRKLIKLRYERI